MADNLPDFGSATVYDVISITRAVYDVILITRDAALEAAALSFENMPEDRLTVKEVAEILRTWKVNPEVKL
jgi:hypothetical protein